MIKRAVSVVLILSAMLIGMACGGSPESVEQAKPVKPVKVEEAAVAVPAEDIQIEFTVPGFGSDPSPFMSAVMQMLEENLGVDIAFETMEWGTFLNKLDGRELQMYSLGWAADWALPDNFLEVLFLSDSAQNHYGYSNPEVDAILNQARVEKDWDERLALYQEAERMIVRDVPVIPSTFSIDRYLTKPWMEGFDIPASIVPFLKDVRVTDPSKGYVVPLTLGDPFGSGDIPGLDPHNSQDVNSSQYLNEMYSGLVTSDPQTLEVTPDIAESWEVSEDGLVYTFHLRKNVSFHNGREVTAHDFKWSFERAADPATKSVTADTYLGDIVGVKEKLNGKASEVSGVRVVDGHTLEVAIKEPIASFLSKLTYPTAYVLDRETVEMMRARDAFYVNPNGTGPFLMTQYVPDDTLVLEPNPNYYRERAGNVEKFVFTAGGSTMTKYENDEVWMTHIGTVDWERVSDPQNPLNAQLHTSPQLSFGYIGFNVTKPPFEDLKIRQAFAMAINNELILKAVGKGMIPPATGILPPGMPGYESTPKVWEFDPDKALSLLKESEYYPRLKKLTK